MMRKIRLTDKKRRWVGKRNVVLRGTPLHYNASLQSRYYSAIRSILSAMIKETRDVITQGFKSKSAKNYDKIKNKSLAQDEEDFAIYMQRIMNALNKKYTRLFEDWAPDLSEEMYEQTANTSTRNLHRSLAELSGGFSLNTSVVPASMKPVAKAIINENVSLITSIPQEYLKKVEGAVMRSITTGKGLSDLVPILEKYSGQSYRRAKNMALDQTRKAYNNINKQKLLSIGVDKYIWRHSAGGQTPRQHHIEMDGNVYSFNNPPIIDPDGTRGIPGDAINCRCFMEPVIEFQDGEKQ